MYTYIYIHILYIINTYVARMCIYIYVIYIYMCVCVAELHVYIYYIATHIYITEKPNIVVEKLEVWKLWRKRHL